MIIGISGKMGSGKDTLGDMLCGIDRSYSIKKYATKLKQIASLLSGIPVERFESQDFKKFDMPTVWNKIKKPTSAYGEQMEKMTVREFLQKIGTDALRDGLHNDVWVNALFADYKERYFGSNSMPNWIITDVRFPNEAQAVIDRGGIMVRINRTDKSRVNADHPSEIALDNWDGFHYTIDNNGTLEDLKGHAEVILKLECF